MNTRSFFKSLALLTAGAAVAPGIFIPKFEPVKWKCGIRDLHVRNYYFGKWQFVTTRFHLVGGVFVPEDPSFESIHKSKIAHGEFISLCDA